MGAITVTNSQEESKRRNERDLDRVNTKAKQERGEKAEIEWRLRPIEKFKDTKDHLTERDLNNRVRIVERFEKYLLEKINPKTDHEILGPRDAVDQDIEDFIENELDPDPNTVSATVDTQLTRLREFYKTLDKNDAYAGNPVNEPLKEYRKNNDTGSDRPYIPKNRIDEFLNWCDHPLTRALWILAFKLGPRSGEAVNIDLWCVNIDHLIYDQIIENHDIQLHPKIRDRPDTVFVYGQFNEGDEVPSGETTGSKKNGEVRSSGNKRKRDQGSVLPVDSELKTALVEWMLVRPSTAHQNTEIHPLFTIGTGEVKRPLAATIENKLWRNKTDMIDNIQRFAEEESLEGENCPTCGADQLIKRNPADAERPGRRFRCRECEEIHWRSIFWDGDLKQSQRVTYHQGRHSFSSAHNPTNSGLHGNSIPDAVRKKAIRGDSNNEGDTEDTVYIEGKYRDFEADVRQPYLDGIYKFGIYDNPIPAVGEGWEQ
jgi:integrase